MQLSVSKCATFILVAILFVFDCAAQQSDKSVFSEIATGSGKTRSEAEQDALKNAIQQAFGVFVESEESLKNGIFDEKILTNSRGFIDSYKVRESRFRDQSVEVTVHAVIRRNPIVQKLKAQSIPIKEGATKIVLDLGKKRTKLLVDHDRVMRAGELLWRAVRDAPTVLDTTRPFIVDVKQTEVPDRFGGPADEIDITVEFEYQYDWERIIKFNVWLDEFLQQSKLSRSRQSVSYSHQLQTKNTKSYSGYSQTEKGQCLLLPFDNPSFFKGPKRTYDEDNLFCLPLLVDFRIDRSRKIAKTKWVMHKVEDSVWNAARKQSTKFGLPGRDAGDAGSFKMFLDTKFRTKFYRYTDRVEVSAYGKHSITSERGSTLFEIQNELPGPESNYFTTLPIYPYYDNYTVFRIPYRGVQRLRLTLNDLRPPKDKDKRRKVPWSNTIRLAWASGQPFYKTYRKWSIDGGPELVATLLDYSKKQSRVTLQVKDSRAQKELKLSELSEADQRYVAEQYRRLERPSDF